MTAGGGGERWTDNFSSRWPSGSSVRTGGERRDGTRAAPARGVWAAAAAVLREAHRSDRRVPIDPELFVAASRSGAWWPTRGRSWCSRRRRCVIAFESAGSSASCGRELCAEVRNAEARLRAGTALEAVLLSKSRGLTPLGRYILAYRAGRPDLAVRLRSRAEASTRACPLYRHACAWMLPSDAYPGLDPMSEVWGTARIPTTPPSIAATSGSPAHDPMPRDRPPLRPTSRGLGSPWII